jgi:hypothetical protein
MLKSSFLKTNVGPKSEPQKTSSSTKASTIDKVKELLLPTPGWQAAISMFNSKEFIGLPPLTIDFAKSFLFLASTH